MPSLKLVWTVTCCIGCAAQIFWLTHTYMKYEVNTAVEFMFHDVINLPSVSVCGYFVLMADWEQLKTRCNLIAEMNETLCQRASANAIRDHVQTSSITMLAQTAHAIIGKVPIDEIVNKLTIRADKLIRGHLHFDNKLEDVVTIKGYKDTFNVTEVVWGQSKCFTLNWKDGKEEQDYWMMKQNRYLQNQFLVLMLDNAIFRSFRVALMFHADNNVIPRYASVNFVIVNSGVSHTLLKFELFENQLLPEPFSTRCLNYWRETQGLLKNRASCYDSCMTNSCLKRFNKKPIPVRFESSDKGIFGMNNDFMIKNSQAIKSLSKQCLSSCKKQDCKQRLFTISQQSAAYNMTVKESEIQFGLNSMPIHRSTTFPKVNFESFATDVSSTFGFWLGISVLSVFEWATDVVSSFVKRNGNSSSKHKKKRSNDRRHVDQRLLFRYGPHGHVTQTA